MSSSITRSQWSSLRMECLKIPGHLSSFYRDTRTYSDMQKFGHLWVKNSATVNS